MAETQYIEVLSNRLRIRIPIQSILWVNTSQNASLLHTDGGIIKTYMTFTNMKALLNRNTNCFLVCYKGCLVNMNRISRIDGIDFMMENGEQVQIRKRDGNRIRQSYVLYRCAQAAGV